MNRASADGRETMIELVTTISLWELLKHTGSWISNLKRAKDERKKESIDALEKVVIASRKTGLYLRQREETGKSNLQTESELLLLWTELGLSLERLKVEKLAKRCRIKGKYWENPEKSDKKFITKADISLEKMEKLAMSILHEINS